LLLLPLCPVEMLQQLQIIATASMHNTKATTSNCKARFKTKMPQMNTKETKNLSG